MARTAILKLQSGWAGRSVQLRLFWLWRPAPAPDVRLWWCEPGYLSAAKGSWEAQALRKQIWFHDEDDNFVLWCLGVDNDYTGYPFTDLKGDRGLYQRGGGGGILNNGDWEFLEV